MPARIFISYANEDEVHRQRLRANMAMLERQELVSVWDRGQIGAGEITAEVIRRYLDQADVVLLLISPYFLASEHCYEQMARAMERHHVGEARVVPILLRDCDWRHALCGKLRALPPDERPITSALCDDDAWAQTIEGIRAIIKAHPQRGDVFPRKPLTVVESAQPSYGAATKRRAGRSFRAAVLGSIFVAVAGSALAFLAPGAFKPREPGGKTMLLWGPGDCAQKEPRVGYGSCNEMRSLSWVQSQMNLLRAARVRGFADLPADPRLEPASYNGKENFILYVGSGSQRLLVGVGYQREKGSNDGCLRLYDERTSARRSAIACLDRNGNWWVQEEESGSYRFIGQ